MTYKQYLLIGIVAYIACFIYYIDFSTQDPGLDFLGVDFLKHYGFDGEEHIVVSEDGFRSKLHRIGHGGMGRKVLVLIPGCHGRSELWVALGPKHDFSYHLYAAGADVWMINVRGSVNTEPSENRTFTDDQLTYFGFQEQGYDMAAAMEYILRVTKQEKVTLASISMGTTIALVFLAERPEYNQRIDKIIMLGPSGPFTEMTSLQNFVFNAIYSNKAIADYIVSPLTYRKKVVHLFCTHPMLPISCWQFVHNYLGYHREGITDEKVAMVFNLAFSGPYTGLYHHIKQLHKARAFVKRDFGKEKNLELYGSEAPPLYNISNVKPPIIIFDARNDKTLNSQARKNMRRLIPNIKKIFKVKPPFEHSNFVSNGAFDETFLNNLIDSVFSNV